MTRTTLAAAAVLTLGLLAPVAAATSAAAVPTVCGASVHLKDLGRFGFVHAGNVTEVNLDASTLSFVVRGGPDKAIRGCTLTVVVTEDTMINRNDAPVVLAEVEAGDHVNVSGSTTRASVSNDIIYTAVRVAAETPDFGLIV